MRVEEHAQLTDEALGALDAQDERSVSFVAGADPDPRLIQSFQSDDEVYRGWTGAGVGGVRPSLDGRHWKRIAPVGDPKVVADVVLLVAPFGAPLCEVSQG